jgi:D-arabinan exo alpha-(1,3)/(1,5)-arabinofuranosidase (non-reducing end)
MSNDARLWRGLGSTPLLGDVRTRSLSAENPTGEKGAGAQSVPDPTDPNLPHSAAATDLGKGWKVRPFIQIPPGATKTIADVAGSGVVRHIWMGHSAKQPREVALRFYWDGEKSPSVEVPLCDFFAVGHGIQSPVTSVPVAVNPTGGHNCYWPMPFGDGMKVTVENQGHDLVDILAYQITYDECAVPEGAARFHAQWRRSMTTREHPEHVLLDGVKGKGQYVGTVLSWTQLSDGWWGEGEIKFYIDGDGEHPTICGTGTEDYFGGAWCFGDTYSTAFLGYPMWQREPGRVPKHTLYRWHILDPIRFDADLRVTIQALGWWPNGKFQPLTDDIASVAFWYQHEPHAAFPALPPVHERWSR